MAEKNMIARVRKMAGQLHNDTSGAMSVEKVMILALIALPIVIVLLAFRKYIVGWFSDQQSSLQP